MGIEDQDYMHRFINRLINRSPLSRALFTAGLALGLALLPTTAQEPAATPANPLSVKIGAFEFTPGGFVDFTTVYRSAAVGSGIGTNFAAIPYNTTVAGRVSELRESAQNSRLTLKIDGVHDSTQFTGYLETDLNGNQPGNVAVSSNSATMRLRVYFMDARHGAWEVLAGQDWSLLTPNRVGLSPMPSDIFYSQVVDTNYQVGLTWARQPQFRLIYHASSQFAAGLSVENAEPYVGGSSGAPAATVPSAFAGQVNNGGTSYAAPSFAPDLIVKAAYDSKPGGHGLHLEAAGLASTFRIFNPATGVTARTMGGGVSLNANLEIAPGLRLVGTSFFGDGGGRYFFGMAPDLVVRQNGAISLVRASGGTGGFEYQINPGYLAYAYYGGVYIRPSFDLSGATPVGYGYPGASSSTNKAIQEATIGITHTFWHSAQYGALQLMLQASYLTRDPYDVASGAPKNAHVGIGYLNLRYSLP
jgi:hypothetical protein